MEEAASFTRTRCRAGMHPRGLTTPLCPPSTVPGGQLVVGAELSAPRNSPVEVLIPRTSDRDCIWRRAFKKVNQGR